MWVQDCFSHACCRHGNCCLFFHSSGLALDLRGVLRPSRFRDLTAHVHITQRETCLMYSFISSGIVPHSAMFIEKLPLCDATHRTVWGSEKRFVLLLSCLLLQHQQEYLAFTLMQDIQQPWYNWLSMYTHRMKTELWSLVMTILTVYVAANEMLMKCITYIFINIIIILYIALFIYWILGFWLPLWWLM